MKENPSKLFLKVAARVWLHERIWFHIKFRLMNFQLTLPRTCTTWPIKYIPSITLTDSPKCGLFVVAGVAAGAALPLSHVLCRLGPLPAGIGRLLFPGHARRRWVLRGRGRRFLLIVCVHEKGEPIRAGERSKDNCYYHRMRGSSGQIIMWTWWV